MFSGPGDLHPEGNVSHWSVSERMRESVIYRDASHIKRDTRPSLLVGNSYV